ncbi:MAG: hypothetical protein COA36_03195 [Desulfotalea sp.]|nr:MAG: hypothetical protein COA36_03195 [Desulfotalea sp.]
MIKKSVFHFLTSLLIITTNQCWAMESKPIQLHQRLEQAVNSASTVGTKTAAWQQEKQFLLTEIQDLELKTAWADFQLEKTKKWLTTEQTNTRTLETNLQNGAATREQLEPFLELLYAELETHINSDLPFLQQERNRRLAHIRLTLDDPEAPLSDKLGRLLRAIQVEVDYGYSIDVTKDLVTTPKGETTQASIFRLGRLSLLRLLNNGTQIERYNKKTNTWMHLTDDSIHEVEKAMEIARKKRVSTLLFLPIGHGASTVNDTNVNEQKRTN